MRIISAENYKIRKSSSCKIMTVICAAICGPVGYAISTLSSVARSDVVSISQDVDAQVTQTLDAVSGFNATMALFAFTVLSQIVTILCAVSAGMLIVSEFDKGTARNALSAGTSRASWFWGKVYTQFAVTLWFTFETALVFVLTTAAFLGWGQPSMDNTTGNFIAYFLMALLQAWAYSSIFLAAAFVIRGVGGTVGFSVAVIILEQFISIILRAFNKDFLNKINDNLLYSLNARMNAWSGPTLTAEFAKMAIPAAAVIAVTLALAYVTFMKRDVK